MQKFSFSFLLCLSFAFPALAQDVSFSLGVAEDAVVSVNDSLNLYNFSDELLNAASGCLPYSENFSDNNPQLSGFGITPEIMIEISGRDEKGLCTFTVSNKIPGLSESVIKCRTDDKQLQEISTAMLDRSLTPVTETFDSYAELEDSEGNIKRLPTKMTITGSRFEIIWNKIRNNACEESFSAPSEHDVKKLSDTYSNLSENFLQHLKDCEPFTETKPLLFFNEEVSIVKKQGRNCLLHYNPFEIILTPEKLLTIHTLEDIRKLTQDENITRYTPEYFHQGLASALDICVHDKKSAEGGTNTETRNNIKITTSLNSAYTDDLCRITFGNLLDNNGKKGNYSRICLIPVKEAATLLAPYTDTLGELRIQGIVSNAETTDIDNELADKLLTGPWCKNKD